MKNIDEHIDLIERYLYDDLTQEELEEFNGLLQKDSEFNKLFYEMDNLLEGIRRSAKQTTVEEKLTRLERSLSMEDTAPEKEEETPVIPIWRTVSRYAAAFTADGAAFTAAISAISDQKYRMAIAAAVSLLIVTTIVLTNLNSTNSPDELFAQYFKAYDSTGGVERGKSDLEKLQVAMIEYEKGNYERAVNIYEQIDITEENRIQIWLYGGNAYLKLENVNKAIISFKNIIDANSGFEIDAKWYLSLCYLKEGDVELARPLLQEIKESGRGRYMDADGILSKLE